MSSNSSVTLESLSDDILYIILDKAPLLRYASKRLHYLAEDLDRHSLVTAFSSQNELSLLDKVQHNPTISQLLRSYSYSVNSLFSNKHLARSTECHPSARSVKAFLQKDICFFSPKHVITPNPSDDISETHVSLESSDPNPFELNTGIWKHITGTKFSPSGTCMYAANVKILDLRYKTKLAPGQYEVYINLKTSNVFRLLSIQFSVKGSPFVRQAFSPFPPSRIAAGTHDHLSEGGEIYMGDITVSANTIFNSEDNDNKDGLWPSFEFEISDIGSHKELQFNYLYFVPKRPSLHNQLGISGVMTPPNNFWEIVPSGLLSKREMISPMLAAAYEELNYLKTSTLA